MRRATILLLSASVAACSTGPDYAGPPEVGSTATARGTFVRAGDPALNTGAAVARWWETLGDPVLTGLVDDALSQSPDISIAQARIREARAKLQQGRAQLLPTLAGTGMFVHARLPGTGLGSLTGGSGGEGQDGGAQQDESSDGSSLNFYNIGANVSWEPDLFGGRRREVEAAQANLDQRFAELADAQVSLSAQVAQSYVNLRDVEERARLNARSSELQRRSLELMRQRLAAGTASRLQVQRLETELASTDAQNIPLDAQIALYRDALAVLTGRTPGELDAQLAGVAPVPLPPAAVPIGDPATLLSRRPDVRTAERALAAGTAQIGAAKARALPGIKFSGILGLGGTEPGDVLDPGNLAALLMPQLSFPVIDFGRSRGAVQEAEAQRDAAEGQYRKAVLSALQDAEDSLARFGATRRQLAQLIQAERSAAGAARLNRQRFEAGTSTLIDQLDIERQQLSSSIAVAQAKAQLTIDYIAIQKALGLGWSEPAEPATR
ncbi:efflux transporter outer membrane subunit [Novosphingobium sp. HII-3]|jgi:NodT family efflux transporter outer membrane factor (OMF) lipoprotein|uniref:efflux transporter outer membrane subunit n=1 Tax=Novosphingobium sp. HII-3 TaxID=2075565 RepID=UPI000CDB6A3C|nr:efflux transporter outer membrane subunit [Novosphingobium sp. HII-3]